jgi:hypothetical protein
MSKYKERTRAVEVDQEAMDKAGIYFHQQCYFVRGTGFVVRMQKGAVSKRRGQNGITKAQLDMIHKHAMEREDLV